MQELSAKYRGDGSAIKVPEKLNNLGPQQYAKKWLLLFTFVGGCLRKAWIEHLDLKHCHVPALIDRGSISGLAPPRTGVDIRSERRSTILTHGALCGSYFSLIPNVV